MRLGTTFPQLSGVSAMLAQQSKLLETQLQLSTGKKILTPADDPSASMRAMSLSDKIESTKQYSHNINFMKERLDLEETTIQDSMDSLQRAREILVEALNYNHLLPSDLEAIAAEADHIKDAVFSAMNTRDAHGEYLFAGNTSQTQPYVKVSPIKPPEYGYRFQGDVSMRSLQISLTQQMQEGDSGFKIFDDIPSRSVTSSANGGKQNIMATLQVLTDAMRGNVRDGSGGVVGADISALFATPGFVPTPLNDSFDLTVDGGEPVTISIPPPVEPAVAYPNIHSLVAAINTGISDTGLSGVQAFAYGNSLQFVSTESSGASSSVTIANAAGLGFSDPQTGVGRQIDATAVLSPVTAQNFPISYAAPAGFFLSTKDGEQVRVELPAGEYGDADTFATGINAAIGATSLSGVVTARINAAGAVELATTAAGANASLQIFDGDSTFRSDAGFVYQQKAMGEAPVHKVMSDLLADIDSALGTMTNAVTIIGARKNAIDQVSEVHDKFVLDMNTALSETQDLDYTEAVSRFNLQQTALQAAQQSYAKVQGLSLFNYIR